jgi:alpha-amylase
MSAVVFYFHVHQPYRIKNYSLYSIGSDHNYFHSDEVRLCNQTIMEKVAHKSYLPFNNLLLHLLKKHPTFKISFSISGTILDQFQQFKPEVLDSFKRLVDTGRVELLNETYYHSLSFLYSPHEFKRQINKHKQALKNIFGYTTTAYRNTELIYNNDIAKTVESLGFKTILAEGVDRYLGWRSPNFVYKPPHQGDIRLLLKNYKLSDDIAFRFSNRAWTEFPLTTDRYADWISSVNGNGHVVNLFMDYETFGEHQWEDTGIFQFMDHLPDALKRHPDNTFMTVSEAAHSHPVADVVDMPDLTSWADTERDLSAWKSNAMQEAALKSLYDLETDVIKSSDDQLIEDWRRLTTSDHFYYMCTKWFSDGDVHKYFSPNHTPYEAYVNFMNILHDLRLRVYANKERRFEHAHTYS